MSSTNSAQIGHIGCLLTLFICGVLLFLFGFFPASYSKVETEESETVLKRPIQLDTLKLTPPAKQYGAFILMLIDALRVDFPNATSMPTTYDSACEKLKLKVDIPTVTMPRLKSITTGTLSNFIDIVLNVGHAEQLDDSLLHRLKQRGDVISFAGDRTWVQLFPSEFKRHAENIDSFFVNDFYKGDENVTKTLTTELEQTDWTLLVLHYLGLDHIGHVEGNKSPKMKDKLTEMDAVIEKILQHKHFPNYLLMLTGDHGMANGGGHGGNTPEEMHVPLYLFRSNCSKSKNMDMQYNQIDLAPTLSILLSLEIPSDSIGCLIPEMLQSLTLEDQLYAYFYNAYHLLNRARIKFGAKHVKNSQYYIWYKNARALHILFLDGQRKDGRGSIVAFQNAKLDYVRVAREISVQLSESLVKFDYGFIFIGLVLIIMSTLQALLCVMYFDTKDLLYLTGGIKLQQLSASFISAFVLNICLHIFSYLHTSSILHSIYLLIPITASIYLGIDVIRAFFALLLPNSYRLKLSLRIPLPLLAGIAIRSLTVGSSSYIEYERFCWYYLGSSLLIFTACETMQKHIIKENIVQEGRELYNIIPQCIWQQRKCIVALIILTWLKNFDVEEFRFKTFLVVFSLFILWTRLRSYNSLVQQIFGCIACVLIYCFQGLKRELSFFQLNAHLRGRLELPLLALFWLCMLSLVVIGYRNALKKDNFYNRSARSTLLQLLQTNMTLCLYISALLHKSYNVVMLPAMMIVLCETYKLCDVHCSSGRMLAERKMHIYKIILTIFIAKMFHFYQGNSNSLSTIDLNPGYIGQTSYNPFIVGILVTLNTYSAGITAFLYLVVHTLRTEVSAANTTQFLKSDSIAVLSTLVIPMFATLIMIPVAFYLCLMVRFRYHLFIYSVFSPKALYDCYDVFVFYLIYMFTYLYFKIFNREIIVVTSR